MHLSCVIFLWNTWVSVTSLSCIHPCHLCTASIIFLSIRHLNKELFPVETPLSSLQYHYGLSRTLFSGGCFGRGRFLCNAAVGSSHWKKARKLNGNFIWCGKKKFLAFFKNGTFSSQISARDISMPASPSSWHFQGFLAPGVQWLQRLLQPSPTFPRSGMGSFVDPSPSFPSSPTLSPGSFNTSLLHEQFAWSAVKTIFPAGHFFPVSHSALNLTFWILWIFS